MVEIKAVVFRPYTGFAMPRISRLKLPPVDLGGETIGERVARLRKERGYTQVELAEKVGIIQTIVSAIETNTLKLSAEMAIRFAMALGVSTDDLLMPAKRTRHNAKPSRKVLRRLELIESLPSHQQQTVLKTIDTMLRGLKSAS
jgi:transcriptional regulator with XRE-family HTH domain